MGIGGISGATVSYEPTRLGAACDDCAAPKSARGAAGDPNTSAQKVAAESLVESRTETAADTQQITEMQRRDREVRAHELAHQAVGGAHAGSPSFIYATGPDGNRYAIGGSVPVDTGKASTPEATIQKMTQVRRAALAPMDPSAADRAIATRASQHLAAARQELLQQRLAEVYGQAESTAESTATQTPPGQEPAHAVSAVATGSSVDFRA